MGDGIRIKVGAAADASLRDVFRPLEDSAKRARRVVLTETETAAKESARAEEKWAAYRAKIIDNTAKMAGRAAKQQADAEIRETERAEKTKSAAVEREARERTRTEERESAKRQRQADREVASAFRAQERERKAEEKKRDQSIQRGQRWALGGMADAGVRGSKMALSFGARVASGVASGVGVDLDLTSHVRRNAELEKNAVDLSNAGYMPGQAGPNGVRQSASQLISDARRVGTETGYGANDAMEGLQQYVGKTGDLKTGRDILKDMAILSKATGASLENMVDAAADVANNLGEVEDKGAVTTELMKAFAGMGKQGAVEVKDLSKQMAGLAAVAPLFGGSRAEAIASMGALAQEARAKGGSKSAAQAVTSVQSFANTFSKGARLKAFRGFGVQTQDSTGALRSAEDIIVDSIVAASSKDKGGMAAMSENMGSMFADVRARGAVRGFENVYREAGGGEAGVKAVREEFEKLKNAAMGTGEVMDSFKRAMSTSEAEAQVFNNQLGELASQLQSQVVPALKDLAPVILKLTQAGIDFVTFVTGNSNVAKSKADAEGEISAANAMGQARVSVKEISEAMSGSYAADADGNQHFTRGTLTTSQLAAAQGADSALQAAIAKKEKEGAEFRAVSGYKSDDQFRAFIADPKNDNNPEAKQRYGKYLNDQDDLKAMKDRENAVHSAIENLTNALGGTLSVRIVEGPTAPPPPRPTIDPTGVHPGVERPQAKKK